MKSQVKVLFTQNSTFADWRKGKVNEHRGIGPVSVSSKVNLPEYFDLLERVEFRFDVE